MLNVIKASLIDTAEASDETSDGKLDKAALRRQKIENFLKTHNYIMNAHVRAMCGVSSAIANRILTRLTAEGTLIKCRKAVIGHMPFTSRILPFFRQKFSGSTTAKILSPTANAYISFSNISTPLS